MKNYFFRCSFRAFILSLALSVPGATALYAQTVGLPFSDASAVTLARPKLTDGTDGGCVLLRIVATHFQLIFLDAKGKVTPPPCDAASVRYVYDNNKNNGKKYNMQLSIDGSGAFLTADRTITPPNIWVWVRLGAAINTDDATDDDTTIPEQGLTPSDNAVESYSNIHVKAAS